MSEASVNEPPAPPRQIHVLQTLLRAEALFLARLREEAAQKCRIPSDAEKIQAALNHENVIHIARFFFLLKALDCTTPQAVEALIEAHNTKIRQVQATGGLQGRAEAEVEKAFFRDKQQYICVKTVREYGRAVFSKAEVMSLLFDHMGRDSADKALALLTSAGLLTEKDSDPLTGTNRKLILTDGTLEDAFSQYLLDIDLPLTSTANGSH